MEPDSKRRKNLENSELIADRPDDWLLHEWKAGDEKAAEVLFNRYAIRLVALVASRLNRKCQAAIDPSEIVQSAMGSFLNAAKHSRIQVSGSVSLWRLLATFARRKMARSIERHSATKRSGGRTQVSFDAIHAQLGSGPDDDTGSEADEFLSTLKMELTYDLFVVAEGLLAGRTQRALAESLGIDERTVRRRLTRLREMLAPENQDDPKHGTRRQQPANVTACWLPRVCAWQIDWQWWFREGLSRVDAIRRADSRRQVPSQSILAKRIRSSVVLARNQHRITDQSSLHHPLSRLRRVATRWTIRYQRVD